MMFARRLVTFAAALLVAATAQGDPAQWQRDGYRFTATPGPGGLEFSWQVIGSPRAGIDDVVAALDGRDLVRARVEAYPSAGDVTALAILIGAVGAADAEVTLTAGALVSAAGAHHRIAVLAAGDGRDADGKPRAPAFAAAVAAMQDALLDLDPPRPGAPLVDEIERALLLLAGQSATRRALVVFARDAALPPPPRLAALRKLAAERGTSVYGFGYGAAPPDSLLRRLSLDTHGLYAGVAPGEEAQIAPIMRRLLTRVDSGGRAVFACAQAGCVTPGKAQGARVGVTYGGRQSSLNFAFKAPAPATASPAASRP